MPNFTGGMELYRDTQPDSSAGDGLKIGVAATSLVGMYGATPVVQAGAITAVTTQASGTQLATAINAIRVALTNIGITA